MGRCFMNGTAKEWTARAEADFSTAARELKTPESPNPMRFVFTPSNALRN